MTKYIQNLTFKDINVSGEGTLDSTDFIFNRAFDKTSDSLSSISDDNHYSKIRSADISEDFNKITKVSNIGSTTFFMAESLINTSVGEGDHIKRVSLDFSPLAQSSIGDSFVLSIEGNINTPYLGVVYQSSQEDLPEVIIDSLIGVASAMGLTSRYTFSRDGKILLITGNFAYDDFPYYSCRGERNTHIVFERADYVSSGDLSFSDLFYLSGSLSSGVDGSNFYLSLSIPFDKQLNSNQFLGKTYRIFIEGVQVCNYIVEQGILGNCLESSISNIVAAISSQVNSAGLLSSFPNFQEIVLNPIYHNTFSIIRTNSTPWNSFSATVDSYGKSGFVNIVNDLSFSTGNGNTAASSAQVNFLFNNINGGPTADFSFPSGVGGDSDIIVSNGDGTTYWSDYLSVNHEERNILLQESLSFIQENGSDLLNLENLTDGNPTTFVSFPAGSIKEISFTLPSPRRLRSFAGTSQLGKVNQIVIYGKNISDSYWETIYSSNEPFGDLEGFRTEDANPYFYEQYKIYIVVDSAENLELISVGAFEEAYFYKGVSTINNSYVMYGKPRPTIRDCADIIYNGSGDKVLNISPENGVSIIKIYGYLDSISNASNMFDSSNSVTQFGVSAPIPAANSTYLNVSDMVSAVHQLKSTTPVDDYALNKVDDTYYVYKSNNNIVVESIPSYIDLPADSTWKKGFVSVFNTHLTPFFPYMPITEYSTSTFKVSTTSDTTSIRIFDANAWSVEYSKGGIISSLVPLHGNIDNELFAEITTPSNDTFKVCLASFANGAYFGRVIRKDIIIGDGYSPDGIVHDIEVGIYTIKLLYYNHDGFAGRHWFHIYANGGALISTDSLTETPTFIRNPVNDKVVIRVTSKLSVYDLFSIYIPKDDTTFSFSPSSDLISHADFYQELYSYLTSNSTAVFTVTEDGLEITDYHDPVDNTIEVRVVSTLFYNEFTLRADPQIEQVFATDIELTNKLADEIVTNSYNLIQENVYNTNESLQSKILDNGLCISSLYIDSSLDTYKVGSSELLLTGASGDIYDSKTFEKTITKKSLKINDNESGFYLASDVDGTPLSFGDLNNVIISVKYIFRGRDVLVKTITTSDFNIDLFKMFPTATYFDLVISVSPQYLGSYSISDIYLARKSLGNSIIIRVKDDITSLNMRDTILLETTTELKTIKYNPLTDTESIQTSIQNIVDYINNVDPYTTSGLVVSQDGNGIVFSISTGMENSSWLITSFRYGIVEFNKQKSVSSSIVVACLPSIDLKTILLKIPEKIEGARISKLNGLEGGISSTLYDFDSAYGDIFKISNSSSLVSYFEIEVRHNLAIGKPSSIQSFFYRESIESIISSGLNNVEYGKPVYYSIQPLSLNNFNFSPLDTTWGVSDANDALNNLRASQLLLESDLTLHSSNPYNPHNVRYEQISGAIRSEGSGVYDISTTDHNISADTSSGDVTFNLPSSSSVSGKEFKFKKLFGDNTLYIYSTNGDLIDINYTSLAFTEAGSIVSLLSIGDRWLTTSSPFEISDSKSTLNNTYSAQKIDSMVVSFSEDVSDRVKKISIPNGNSYSDIVYGDYGFVAVANNQDSMVSTNGISWVELSMEQNDWGSVAYGNGVYVTGARNSVLNGGRIAYRSNGSWSYVQLLNTTVSLSISDVRFLNGYFYAVSNYYDTVTYSFIRRSVDGVTWETVYADGGFAVRSIESRAPNTVVVTTNTNKVLYCSDLTLSNWSFASCVSADWVHIEYGAGKFVATTASPHINSMYSVDGITWTPFTTSTGSFNKLKFLDNKFIALNSSTIYKSLDGLLWEELYNTLDTNMSSICYRNTAYVISSDSSGVVLTLEDPVVIPSKVRFQSLVELNGPLNFMPRSKALVSAVVNPSMGDSYFVSDDVNGPVLVIYDGATWRRVSDWQPMA